MALCVGMEGIRLANSLCRECCCGHWAMPPGCGGAKIDEMNIFPLEMSWRCSSICGDNNVRIQRQLLAEGEVDVAQSIRNFFLSKISYFSDLETE